MTYQINAFAAELGGDGEITHQQRLVVQRAAWAHQRLQEIEGAYATGAGFDAQEWALLTGVLFQALKLIGMGRRAKPVTGLHDYMARKSSAPARAVQSPTARAGHASGADPDETTPQ